ncbi:Dihydrofolate reductase [Georgenia satyanarayanai]|uniref:Dihydrofolate reductase n=1 Tax=Georgenia satyanarayanai TaxID=860221 RepID=A0A2Y9AT86_9MICO|nr:dihydrofolate reductase family protein [Georgenia satyanarayanai]PYF95945.1 dihydrofolate reductase [Georgenia satyanarayanai]SSA47266.1 Dihydrofolate reductase [Georgenia satyanarayanai]
MQLIVHTFVSLDGVMQGPGGPEEDTSGGFDRGGWVVPLAGEGFGRVVDGWFERTSEVLFGRATYETMAGYWPQVTDPADVVAARLNGCPKHVVSTTLTTPAWENTASVIADDVAASVRALKERPGEELQVHGSWQLIQTLHKEGLVDEYRVIEFPVVLGTGKRLFHDGAAPSGFDAVETEVLDGGLVYRVLRPVPFASGTYAVEDGKESAVLGS